ncbi:MAG: glycosyltransferase family 2 protein [Patescibacteria group bacterium]|nr:glycosyltransferase family 2 protein [Patescibacteria group bacterium]
MKRTLHFLAYGASIYIPIFLTGFAVLWFPESSAHNAALSDAKFFWFTGIVFVAMNCIGLLFGSPWHDEQKAKRDWLGWPSHKKLIVTYVSRGENQIALERAIASTKLILEDLRVQYWIEAVTDKPVEVGADTHYVVPEDYQTPNGAKYKARALHYASQLRKADRNSFVLHMDEESIITEQVIHGIHKFIHSSPSLLRIGQGEIKYNAHNYGKNILITAIDAIRTGDDLGRFRTQYKVFKKPLFGMHGSFFVVPSLLERKVGFDLGGKGSITEDAYFALICADRGVRFEWVEGFIREQSPFTLLELLKQRRRWITGLRLLMWDKTISLRQRLILGVNMTLWRAAWIGPVVTLWNVISGGSSIPIWAQVLSAFLSAMVVVVYMIGAYRNVTDIDLPTWKQITIWLASGILVPIACAVEGIAVLYSIVQPVKVFEVVEKN